MSWNKKGSVILRINRSPKLILAQEIPKLAEALEMTQQETWVNLRKKKIPVELPKLEKLRRKK